MCSYAVLKARGCEGSGFRKQVRAQIAELSAQGSDLKAQDQGHRTQGSGLRAQGL
jgi:hypothetical protein